MKERIGRALLKASSGIFDLLGVFCTVLTFAGFLIGGVWLLLLGKWELGLSPLIVIPILMPLGIMIFGLPWAIIKATLEGLNRPGKWAFAELAEKLEPIGLGSIIVLWSAFIFWLFIGRETPSMAVKLGHGISIALPLRLMAYASSTGLSLILSKKKAGFSSHILSKSNQIACLGLCLLPSLFNLPFQGLLLVQVILMTGYILLVIAQRYATRLCESDVAMDYQREASASHLISLMEAAAMKERAKS